MCGKPAVLIRLIADEATAETRMLSITLPTTSEMCLVRFYKLLGELLLIQLKSFCEQMHNVQMLEIHVIHAQTAHTILAAWTREPQLHLVM